MDHSISGRRSAAIRAAILGATPKRTYKQVADATGISYAVLTHMAGGRTAVTDEVLAALRRYLNLPDDWPDGLTDGPRDAPKGVRDTYMIVHGDLDRLPLIHPGDSLEIQPSALPRAGVYNIVRVGQTDVLTMLEVDGSDLKSDRDLDLSVSAAVGYVIAVFGEDGFAFTSEKGISQRQLEEVVKRRA